MDLTDKQKQSLARGEAVPIDVDGTNCVVIRKDVYEQGKSISYDEMDPEEAYPMIEAVLADEDT